MSSTITITAGGQRTVLTVATTGPQGATGATGPANSLSIGTVTTGAPGSQAAATITGAAPNQTLSLAVPRGDTGATGATGPANSLSIGTVTTGAAGSVAAATITGAAPAQVLDLTIPQGVAGVSVTGNLLTTGQATFEDGTTVWQGAGGSPTFANDTAYAWQGTRSLKVTNAGGGIWLARPSAILSGPAVVPGQPYTAHAYVRSSVTDPCNVRLYWYTAAGALVTTTSSTAVDCSAGWTRLMVTGVAPATAALGIVVVAQNAAGTAGGEFWIDGAGIWQGAGGIWAAPGVPVTGIGLWTDTTLGLRTFAWDDANSTWRLIRGDTGWRAISTWDTSGTVTGEALGTGWAPTASTAGGIWIRRVGNTCFIRGNGFTNSVGSNSALVIGAKVGWAPSDPLSTSITPTAAVLASAANVFLSWGNGLGRASNSNLAAGVAIYNVNLVYHTSQAWPSILPGTAVGNPI